MPDCRIAAVAVLAALAIPPAARAEPSRGALRVSVRVVNGCRIDAAPAGAALRCGGGGRELVRVQADDGTAVVTAVSRSKPIVVDAPAVRRLTIDF